MRITAIQEPPVYSDREATLARGVDLIARAAAQGAQLVVFPEAWVPGYLDWVWALTPSNDTGAFDNAYRQLYSNAVDLAHDGIAPMRDAAREHGVVVVVGVNERSDEMAGGTIYNTGVVIDATGEILNAHRKLMPTNPERGVWGFGDGGTLKVVDTAAGRIGVLMCWETFMPLARMALYAQNMDIYCVPTAYNDTLNDATMQHIAKEGGCAVVSACNILPTAAVPPDHPAHGEFQEWGDWVSPGGAIVVHPGGSIAGGPMRGETGLLTAEVDLSLVRTSRRTFDVAGHYSRPDVFSLSVNRARATPVRFETKGPE